MTILSPAQVAILRRMAEGEAVLYFRTQAEAVGISGKAMRHQGYVGTV